MGARLLLAAAGLALAACGGPRASDIPPSSPLAMFAACDALRDDWRQFYNFLRCVGQAAAENPTAAVQPVPLTYITSLETIRQMAQSGQIAPPDAPASEQRLRANLEAAHAQAYREARAAERRAAAQAFGAALGAGLQSYGNAIANTPPVYYQPLPAAAPTTTNCTSLGSGLVTCRSY